jgi:hypothetical protein
MVLSLDLSRPPYDHIESVTQSYRFIIPRSLTHTSSVPYDPYTELSQEWPSQDKGVVCPVQLDGGYTSPTGEARQSSHRS